MNAAELTGTITAIANGMSRGLTVEEMTLLGMVFTMLGDTIATIAAHQDLQESREKQAKA